MTKIDKLKAFFLADGAQYARIDGASPSPITSQVLQLIADNDELEAIRDYFTKREPLVQGLIEAAATYNSYLAQEIAVEMRELEGLQIRRCSST